MKRRQTGIKRELILFTMGCIICIVFILSAGSVYLSYDLNRRTLNKCLKETSELVSEKITQQLKEYSVIAESIALYQIGNAAREGNIALFLNMSSSQYGLNKIDILSKDGVSIVNGDSYNQDPAFLQAKEGTASLSDPIVKEGNVSYEYIYPYGDIVVVLEFPYSVFEEIIKDTKLGDTGITYMINRNGRKMAHEDFSLVLAGQNDIEDAKKDPGAYGEAASLERSMINGDAGFRFFRVKGEKKIGAYTPIADTNGWSVNVTAMESEFMSGVTVSMLGSLLLGIVSMILAGLAMLHIANRITKPIGQAAEAIERLSGGDLNLELSVKRSDEIGQIVQKVNEMAGKYKDIISDISRFLHEISSGNLQAESGCQYPGEFNGIRTSMEAIAFRLRETLLRIKASADEVTEGSGQVWNGAQELAKRSAEQSGAIEELQSAMTGVFQQSVKNAEYVKKASVYVTESGKKVDEGNLHMHSLNQAMEEVDLTSRKINGITKLIEDIAFQTNILALNAAVEAGRAGAAGKGFGVVADEVRNLAAKSADAAKETKGLVEQSVNAVSKGRSLAENTDRILKEIAGQAGMTEEVIRQIEVSSMDQVQVMEQINQSLLTVSEVVQSNMETARESSDSSKWLAGQAQALQTEVSHFRVNEQDKQIGSDQI
ncbi:methyl-accepting chemotaxis protein [Lacrimispora amygdalina]|uniref:Methyl-accepting chemotaxis protein n=1 Tax=Lacrimispora amygdalina TaxID=253257 RepID=A0A3E2N5P2_9FIRM|nr:methyl-accepting chemotaxis protein [Clostridium indicum]RFZ76318.1 methyl-accepting chemotaxis protein [Clostridium indicum]